MLVVAALLEELCMNYCRNSGASWKGAYDTDDSDILSMSAADNPQTTQSDHHHQREGSLVAGGDQSHGTEVRRVLG